MWSVTLTILNKHNMETLLFGEKGKLSWGGSSWINSSKVHMLVCKKGEQCVVLSRSPGISKN
jgi:hypothetical protein